MRNLIKTQADLTTFMTAIDTIAGAVTYGDKLSDQGRNKLAAEALGFDSVDDMNAFYQDAESGNLFKAHHVIYDYKGEIQTFLIALPADVDPEDVAEVELMACMNGTDYNPANENQSVTLGDGLDIPMTLKDAEVACNGVLTRETIGTGVTFFSDMEVDFGNHTQLRLLMDELRSACLNGTFVDLGNGFVDTAKTQLETELYTKTEFVRAEAILREMEVPEEVIEFDFLFDSNTHSFPDSPDIDDGYLLLDRENGMAAWCEKSNIVSVAIFNFPKAKQG